MASSFKTPFLKLSKYIGKDKPKMEDINRDNDIIDTAIKSHSEDKKCHVTLQEKNQIKKFDHVMGTYIGDGKSKRIIELGFKPRFGMIFQKDEHISSLSPQGYMEQRIALFTELGCTAFTKIVDNGVEVVSSTGYKVEGKIPKYNINQKEYIYVFFK